MNDMLNDQRVADAMRRQNFYLFLISVFKVIAPHRCLSDDLYLEVICFTFQEAMHTPGERLMVTLPPRHLKSIIASVAFPAWILGQRPETKIILASYADALVREHARMFRSLVSSSFYKRVFPHMRLRPAVSSATEFVTIQGGGRRGVTVGGSVTGIGADLIIIDDVMKASDAASDARREEVRRFYDETLYTRLNSKEEGTIIVVQQRLHPDDLIAHLKDRGGYRHLNMPAIAERDEDYDLYNNAYWKRSKGDVLAPGHEPKEILDRIRQEIGEAAFRTQYQQDPASAGSQMLNFEKVTVLDHLPEDHRNLKIMQVWDTAIKDGPNCDYSVGMTFGWDGERWVVLDVERARLKFGDLKARAARMYRYWEPDLAIVEDSANGSAMVADLHAEGLNFKTRGVKGAKEERFAIATEWLEMGKLVLLRNAPYFEDLRRELVSFPEGRYDDQVDVISLFVRRARSPKPISRPRAFRRTKS